MNNDDCHYQLCDKVQSVQGGGQGGERGIVLYFRFKCLAVEEEAEEDALILSAVVLILSYCFI